MASPSDEHPALPPDEEAFYAAWLGRMWPRYRPLFESKPEANTFEWRSAVHPLWLLSPGLHLQFLGFVTVVVAVSAALSPELVVTALFVLLVVVFWPLVVAGFVLSSVLGDAGLDAGVLGVGMLAVSLAIGILTPRWVVSAGRRRWRRQAGALAAGREPPPPRALTRIGTPGSALVLALLVVPAILLLVYGSRDTHDQMYRAALRSDLRNLVTAQEAFFADSLRYSGSPDSMGFAPSSGVTLSILSASDSGWAAVATHQMSRDSCGIFVGPVRPPVEGSLEGEPRCVRR